jgi:hypothetical protein
VIIVTGATGDPVRGSNSAVERVGAGLANRRPFGKSRKMNDRERYSSTIALEHSITAGQLLC